MPNHSQVWFTSDSHFGHRRIIQYTNRPFPDVEAMDEALIANWNARVKNEDTVYHLGDFCFGLTQTAASYFARLQGNIHVLRTSWHHDKSWLPSSRLSGLVSANGTHVVFLPPMEVLLFPQYGDGKHPKPVVLCHYPIARWDRSHYGSWHLYGHCHGQFNNGGLSMDVGVDATGGLFRPISIEEVATEMQRKSLVPVGTE